VEIEYNKKSKIFHDGFGELQVDCRCIRRRQRRWRRRKTTRTRTGRSYGSLFPPL